MQCLDRQSSPPNSSHGREARVIPSTHDAPVDKVMKFALREKGVDKVEPTKVPNLDLADAHGVGHPPILRIAVAVLVCTKSMSDAFDGVDNGASKVVGRIDLPFVTERTWVNASKVMESMLCYPVR